MHQRAKCLELGKLSEVRCNNSHVRWGDLKYHCSRVNRGKKISRAQYLVSLSPIYLKNESWMTTSIKPWWWLRWWCNTQRKKVGEENRKGCQDVEWEGMDGKLSMEQHWLSFLSGRGNVDIEIKYEGDNWSHWNRCTPLVNRDSTIKDAGWNAGELNVTMYVKHLAQWIVYSKRLIHGSF